MYPLNFNPILKSMIWGGEKLRQYKAISTDQKNIGESWELSGVPGNESVVSNGEFAGRSFLRPKAANPVPSDAVSGFSLPDGQRCRCPINELIFHLRHFSIETVTGAMKSQPT